LATKYLDLVDSWLLQNEIFNQALNGVHIYFQIVSGFAIPANKRQWKPVEVELPRRERQNRRGRPGKESSAPRRVKSDRERYLSRGDGDGNKENKPSKPY
jgi:hypothetical protein